MKLPLTTGVILSTLVLGLAGFLFFQNLSAPAIRIWDEAIYADNALDMYTYGNPIVMSRNGEPTLYNTKPPLVIWLQALSMHVFGVGEFAVRFPSALAGILTALLLLIFSVRTLGDYRIGLIAVLILATTGGYVHQHVIRTGDLDAVLVFWTTLYTLLALTLMITRPVRPDPMIIWTAVGVFGAFMSKGVAGLIPVMGLLVCAGITGNLRRILARWPTWWAAGIVVIASLSYYVIREALIPGYLYRVFYSEISRLYENILPWSNQPWYYYFWNWERLDFFTPYIYVLPLAIATGLAKRKYRWMTGILIVQVLVFVGILSYPLVKLMWYDAPVYPLLALICGIGFVAGWDWVADKLKLTAGPRQWVAIVFTILVFALPVHSMYQQNAAAYLPVDILEREGFSIRDLEQSLPEVRQYNVLMLAGQNAHYTQVDFYLNLFNRYKGYEISLLRDTALVRPGDLVLCCQETQLQWLEANFAGEVLSENAIGCQLIAIQHPISQ